MEYRFGAEIFLKIHLLMFVGLLSWVTIRFLC